MIYFIRSGKFVKIGTAKNVRQRLRELQIGNPEKLELIAEIPGSLEREQRLHSKLSEIRHRGEWFPIEVISTLLNEGVKLSLLPEYSEGFEQRATFEHEAFFLDNPEVAAHLYEKQVKSDTDNRRSNDTDIRK